MGLSFRPGTGVPGMAVRFVGDLQMQRGQGLAEQAFDALFARHGTEMGRRRSRFKSLPALALDPVPAHSTRMRHYQPRQDAFVKGDEPWDPKPKTRRCDHPGCQAEGLYRAPRSPNDLGSYYWFCLEHVQAYNRSWDFCKGMDVDAIENMVRADTTWQRPTWPLGRQEGCVIFDQGPGVAARDPFNLFQQGRARRQKPAQPALKGPEAKAMRELGLEPGYTEFALKRRYKELARKHHPDANNGDKAAEERFKSVTQAYKILLDRLKADR